MGNLKMPDINNVMIAGNLTNEPSFRKTTNGTSVANFHIASNRKFKDNSGQWRENVCFIGVVAWHKLAESCFEFLTKGSAVLVEGELQSRSWKNNDGTSNNVVEIKARRIQFLNRQPKKDEAMTPESDETLLETKEGAPKKSNDSVENTQESFPTPNENSKDEEFPSNSEFKFGYDGSNL
ncbi:single-stranded DNA-binding protein [candidate division KSB1 bacterium]|nr:single-stranded DNA-binding protein [candidate division KSB1 bacterium]NIR69918.1 single-stranded DNA-binding protein [candidate division KSB1 bacterium]NIS25827.1 single-stranded DNA-binding protein [candidate division KSB1 bacterium]NIT72702.1 single-stranded DNA-binding protein [candidate division KSB1 bacterium]NIU26516.1 single-stranded DNA-binding protein [candidate division KSB1 bacterium]